MAKHFQDIQKAFAAHIRNPDKYPAPDGIEARRAKIYTELFYNNVEGFLSRTFPICKSMLGEKVWHTLVRDFFETHHCQSPHFVDISRECMHYLQNERNITADPPFLLELAHYEWMELALETSQDTIPETGFQTSGNLLKGQVLLSPLVHVLHYQWPVHRINTSYQPDKPEPCFLLMYRDHLDEVRMVLSNAITARLLSIIQEHDTLTGQQAIEQIATEMQEQGMTVDIEQLLQHGEEQLKVFHQQGIVLGTRLQSVK